MTPEERIQAGIVAAYRSINNLEPVPDVKKLFGDDPDLLVYARGEIRRLREPGKRGVLADTDYESKIRCQALERMIAIYEEPS